MNLETLNKRVLATYEKAVISHDIGAEEILKSLASLTAFTMNELSALSVTVDDQLKLSLQDISKELIEVPAFLLEMSQQMHQQSNRCTAEPIWQVRCKRYLITEEGYNDDHWEIVDTDGDGYALYCSDECDNKKALAEWLLENELGWCDQWLEDIDVSADIDNLEAFSETFIESFIDDFNVDSNYDALPAQLKKFHLQETEEVVKTCLTEVDARAFIARKQHDYPKLYTYVESMVFCPQMIELRHWIMSLTKPEVAA